MTFIYIQNSLKTVTIEFKITKVILRYHSMIPC